MVSRRINVVAVVLTAGLLFLLARFGYLQIIETDRYRAAATENCVKLNPLAAPRGDIVDRNGEVLVSSRPSFRVSLVPKQLPMDDAEQQAALAGLVAALDLDPEWLADKLADADEAPLTPIRLKGGLSSRQIASLEERRLEFPGLLIEAEPLRVYEHGSLAAHLLGFIGEVSLEELQEFGGGYIPGDLVGKSGAEKAAEAYLKGSNGGLEIEVDSLGRQVRLRGIRPAKEGQKVYLTIDRRLQERAEELLGDRSGVVIAMEAKTGEILVMASSPRFDPNWFAGGISWSRWKRLISDPATPLQNKAIQALYAPGSIFKIVTTVAALETGELTEEKTYSCEGVFWIKTWPYKCWNEVTGHGWLNITAALIHSCDIFFYKTGLSLKVDLLAKYAEKFGFGERTGIDLPGEQGGLVPTRQWKEKLFHLPWFPGNTVQLSIGQSYLLSTPLQLVQLMDMVALEGCAYRPHVLKRVEDEKGNVIQSVIPQVTRRLSVSPSTWKILRKGLWGAVNYRDGTGWRAHMAEMQISGKTSTIQNPHGENHSAFGAYAPADDPEIVVVTFIEHGLAGGYIAALITRSVLDMWLTLKRTDAEVAGVVVPAAAKPGG